MANRIIITDEDFTGDTIRYVLRQNLPQTIPGLTGGDWFIVNTAMSAAVSVTGAVQYPAIWTTQSAPTITTPTTINVPSGQREIYIPVTASSTDRQSFYCSVGRLVNVSGGGINVGDADNMRRILAGMDVVYRWSPGDDLGHYIKLVMATAQPAGRSLQAEILIKGIGDVQKRLVTVIFAADATHPAMPAQFHRPLRRLVLDDATRGNTFDPAALQYSDSGFANGQPVWRSRLAHGYSQPGNGETGVYMSDEHFPGVAQTPLTYDATEQAIRLHTLAFPDDALPIFESRQVRHQAAVLQGQTIDAVCGATGVWRMVAKIPVRRYSWPAFWLVGRGPSGASGGYDQWPPEVDILEKFNQSWGAADTPYTTTFGQHYGNAGSNSRIGSFGGESEVNQWLPGTGRLDSGYHSWACMVAYDPVDTRRSEATFFFDDVEVGCETLYARHQDMQSQLPFYPIFNVAVKAPAGYTATQYNTDDGRNLTGDMWVRDIAYYPSGAAVMAINGAIPVNAVAPSVSWATSQPAVSYALAGSVGAWRGDGIISYDTVWQYSANGTSGWTTISGATARNYTPISSQEGGYLRFGANGRSDTGTAAVVYSDPVGPIAAPASAVPPFNLSATPTITAMTVANRTETAFDATGASSGRRTIVWQNAILVGSRVRLRIENTGPGDVYPRFAATSDLSGTVFDLMNPAAVSSGQSRDIDVTITSNQAAQAVFGFLFTGAGSFKVLNFSVTQPGGGSAPQSTVAPAVTGDPQVGQSLSASTGTWSGAPTAYARQWQESANGTSGWANISGATSGTYAPDVARQGVYLRCGVIASNANGASAAAYSAAVGPVAAAGPGAIAGTVTNPPFATALNWMAPGYMSHSPFINVLKIAPELMSYGGSAPDLDWDALQAAGHITRNGTINSLPPNKDMIASSTLNRFPAGSGYSGRYRLFYTGSGQIYMNGVDNVDDGTPGQIDFDFTANGENSVFFSVWGVTTPITFVAMVRHSDLAAYAAGQVFDTKWLNIIRNERVIRFRQYTNAGNYIGTINWATRYLPERMTYMGSGGGGSGNRGVPVEVMCDICNAVGADPWFPLIASASDSYATSFATLVRDRLDPKRHAYFELSDKVWDGANFATADYFRQLANTWYGSTSVESCMDAYGGRSAEVFTAIRAVWAGQLSRLHTVLQGWTPVPTLSVNVFTAPQWRALGSGRPEPWTLATEYAVHCNMDGAMRGTDPDAGYDAVAEIQGWMDTLTDAEIYANMIQALRGTHPIVNDGYNLASIRANYQATKTTLAAYLPSLNTICYEGISHLVLPPGKQDDPKWIRIYRDLHRTAAFRDFMADVMTMWYQEWPEASHMFMRSSECRKPDAHNTEGLTWSLEDTGSDNLQYTYWVAQRAARQGATGRGASDFIGTAEVQ